MPLLVKDAMTTFPFSVSINDPIDVAVKIMEEHGFRHLPVLKDGMPYSVVSEREIRTVFAAFGDELPESRRLVEDFCSIEAYIVAEDTPLHTVVSEMAKRHIGSVVVTSGKRLAGIFTATDACRVLAETLNQS